MNYIWRTLGRFNLLPKDISLVRQNQSGNTIVVFALVLPLVLGLGLVALELFHYFRAVAIIQRAASEASLLLNSATPQEVSHTPFNTITSVNRDQVVSTILGMSYEPFGGVTPTSAKLPFNLNRTTNGFNVATKNPGVQYLPFISAYTCLEPLNESSHKLGGNCGDAAGNIMNHTGFLTYQSPARLDFDGDGAEDTAFFYPNAGDDWWVILSSMPKFQTALRVDLGMAPAAGQRPELPCPGDYDGDGKTDFCVMSGESNSADGLGFNASGSGHIYVWLKLSTKNYEAMNPIDLTISSDSDMQIPVVGKYKTDAGVPTADRFAVISLESSSTADSLAVSTLELSTYIWPQYSINNQTIADTKTSYTDYRYKPSPGRSWRPCNDDINGDGLTEICWFEWEGGNPTAWFAGNGSTWTGESIDLPSRAANQAPITPWALYYPKDSSAAGLYVVDRNAHYIWLIPKGTGILGDGDAAELAVVVAGLDYNKVFGGAIDETFASPDPWQKFDYPDGGAFNTTPARRGTINNPTSVATVGRAGDPLFIADYNNGLVRMIRNTAGGQVTGSNNETMTTIAGGPAIRNGAACGNSTGLNGGVCINHCAISPITGDGVKLSCPAICLANVTAQVEIDPSCVTLQPLSLEVIKDGSTAAGDQPVLLIGDRQGVIWIYQPKTDTDANGSIWGDTGLTADDKIQLLAGRVNQYTNGAPTAGQADATSIGLPVSISARTRGANIVQNIYVAFKSNGMPINSAVSGGVGIINYGADLDWRSGAAVNRDETIAVLAGTFATTTTRPAAYASSASNLVFRNPTSLVSTGADFSGTYPDNGLGIFVTGWWYNQGGATTPFENSLIHLYWEQGGAFRARWLNNPHSNFWGMLDPLSNSGYYMLGGNFVDYAHATSISNLPLQPGSGVALSPDNKYLYISEPQQKRIWMMNLDQDADSVTDLMNCALAADCSAFDGDADGDGIAHNGTLVGSPDKAGTSFRDAYFYTPNGTGPVRPMETYADPVMWAVNPFDNYSIAGSTLQRLEWMIDGFVSLQNSGSSPRYEANPNTILGKDSVVVAIPRQVSIDSGANLVQQGSVGPILSPAIMKDRTPNEGELKNEGADTQCDSSWNLCESTSVTTSCTNNAATIGLTSAGLVTGNNPCSRSLTAGAGEYVYQAATDTRMVGLRRARLSSWRNANGTNRWHPFGSDMELNFIDRDATNGRNPSIYVPNANFIMHYTGNLNSLNTNYPGCWLQNAMSNLNASLVGLFGFPALTALQTQFSCALLAKTITASNANMVAEMIDHQVDSKIFTGYSSTTTTALSGNRLSTTGPVVASAKAVISQNLKHTFVANLSNPPVNFQTMITISASTIAQAQGTDVNARTITIKYVHPLFSVLSHFLGGPNIIIERKATAQEYNFGR